MNKSMFIYLPEFFSCNWSELERFSSQGLLGLQHHIESCTGDGQELLHKPLAQVVLSHRVVFCHDLNNSIINNESL